MLWVLDGTISMKNSYELPKHMPKPMHKKTSIICANLWQTSHVVGAQRNRLNKMTPIISQNTSKHYEQENIHYLC